MFSTLVFALALIGTCHAQDLITKRDGTDIKAKILEVSPDEIKYKNWDNLEGPTFIVYTSDILLVRYSNGTNQVYNTQKRAETYKPNNGYFISDVSLLQDGMRYKQLKDLYDKNLYDSLDNPKYGLARPWLNLIMPGIAQYTMNEPELGTTFLLSSLGADAVAIMGSIFYSKAKPYKAHATQSTTWGKTAEIVYPNGMRSSNVNFYYTFGIICMGVGGAAIIGLTVWSILNAYDIAKVKSLYHDDLKMTKRQYSLFVAPTLESMTTPDGTRLMPALGLRLNF